MGMNSFAPYSENFNCFVVLNIANPKKTIRIFDNPILWGTTRDLMKLRGISIGEINSSLIKGTLNHKIRAGEIIVLCSDIDLLQFNDQNKKFLQSAGISKGLSVGLENLSFVERKDVQLIGPVDNVNTTFLTPNIFIVNVNYDIVVYKNGVKQVLGDDYIISEGGGPGTGYNMVIFTVPPIASDPGGPADVMTADYFAII